MWRTASPADAVAGDGPDGWVTLRLRFEDEEQACFVVLGHGSRAEVVEPASLRERVDAELAAAAARSRGRGARERS